MAAANSAFDDEDLALSINPSHTRRGSARSPGEEGPSLDATLNNASSSHRQAQQQQQQQADARAGTITAAAYPSPRQLAGHTRRVKSASKEKQITTRLGQYEILRTLGEGSFGKVKLAVHQVSGQRVALKIISRRKLMARDMQGRIEREISYLQLLRHPHIIKLYTVITTSSEIIMVLEYAGSELFNYIVEHGKMPEDKARKFFQQIVCAVEYCHRHKIVHRDLKPENLLLDEHLHVKIADFGLSNIMTDGNFLKTSCGSPNYAAPEVISGKLYAGPEVDVWSCGVILFVLLCGRLPFDDEYIPALFKKIAQGTYEIPKYLSPGATHLIRRMLQTSPVNRITVQQIREDPWFNKNLPDYLQPQMEESLDIGIDPNKAIDPMALTSSKPLAAAEKLHNTVISKLAKTTGYGQEDVQNALALDEPNALKDAYLIVRENQIMRETPSLTNDPSLQPFLAQSPPIVGASPIAQMTEHRLPRPSPLKSASPADADRQRPGAASTADSTKVVNSIAVLPSSLPDFYKAYVEGQPPRQQLLSKHDQIKDAGKSSSPDAGADTSRNLKPHSKSTQSAAAKSTSAKPEGMTPIPKEAKKPKQTRWQFGIRSRNQPAEAMLAIYKALKAMGAEWKTCKVRRPGGASSETGSHRDDNESGFSSSGTEDEEDSDDEEEVEEEEDATSPEAEEVADAQHQHQHRHSTGSNMTADSSYHGRQRPRHGSWDDWGYDIPQDPWIINARFRKEGMYPPGVLHLHSANSSRTDLHESKNNAGSKVSDHANDPALAAASARARRSSTWSSASSVNAGSSNTSNNTSNGSSQQAAAAAATSENASHVGPASANFQPVASVAGNMSHLSLNHQSAPVSRNDSMHVPIGDLSAESPLADDSAYVYMTIQLYSIEKEFFVVDFKCAGYERLIRVFVNPDGPTSSIAGQRIESAAAVDTLDTNFSIHDRVTGKPRSRHGQGYSYYGDLDEESEDDEAYEVDEESGQFKKRRVATANITVSRGKETANGREEFIGEGRATEEKDVSSPYPFLDVASKLIIQLAEAD